MGSVTFDWSIGFGSIITMALMGVGFIGAWYTLKSQFAESVKRHSELDTKVAVLDSSLQAHKLHSSEHFVRRDDIEKMEDRISKMFGSSIDGFGRRMEQVEHTVRNIDTKILSIVQLVTKRGNRDD